MKEFRDKDASTPDDEVNKHVSVDLPTTTAPSKKVVPPIPSPEEEVEDDLDDDGGEPRQCGTCFYYGEVDQGTGYGLCLKKSIRSKNIKKVLWVKDKDPATECKSWLSDGDVLWTDFWGMVDEWTVEDLQEFIKNLKKSLADKKKEEIEVEDEDEDELDFEEDNEDWLDEGDT